MRFGESFCHATETSLSADGPVFPRPASDWFTAGPKYHVVSFMCHIKICPGTTTPATKTLSASTGITHRPRTSVLRKEEKFNHCRLDTAKTSHTRLLFEFFSRTRPPRPGWGLCLSEWHLPVRLEHSVTQSCFPRHTPIQTYISAPPRAGSSLFNDPLI